MAKAHHQAAWRSKSRKTRVEVYLSPDELTILDSLPGTRTEALRALLAKAGDSLPVDNKTLPVESTGALWPAEPEPMRDYRRPDPTTPPDPRCQATNRDGSRCGAATRLVARAPDPKGRLAEFGTCKRHQGDFRPHPSVTAEPL